MSNHTHDVRVLTETPRLADPTDPERNWEFIQSKGQARVWATLVCMSAWWIRRAPRASDPSAWRMRAQCKSFERT